MYKKIALLCSLLCMGSLSASSFQNFEDIHELSITAHSMRLNIITSHSYNVGVSAVPNLILDQEHTHLAITEGDGTSTTAPVTITVPHGCHMRLNITKQSRASLDKATAPLVLIAGDGGIVNVYSGNCPVLDVTIHGMGTVNMHNTQLGDVYKNIEPTGRFLTNTRPDLLSERVAPKPDQAPHDVAVSKEVKTTFIPFFPEHLEAEPVTEQQSFRTVTELLNSSRFYHDLRTHGNGDVLAEIIRTARCSDDQREMLWYLLTLRAMAAAEQHTVIEKHDGHPVRTTTTDISIHTVGKMYKEAWATLRGKLPKIAFLTLASGGIGCLIGYAIKHANQSVWQKVGYSFAGAGISAAVANALYIIAHAARRRYRHGMEKVIENLMILKERWADAMPASLRTQLIEFFDQLEDAPYNSTSAAALYKRQTLVAELYKSIKINAE